MEFFILFLIGLCVGSFCNVLAERLPRGEDVLVSRSHCDFCKKILSWYELIPLFSFILQNRRCRHCHKKLSFQYPFVELITGIGFVITAMVVGLSSPLLLLSSLIIFSMCVVILVADLKYFIIPDATLVVMSLMSLYILTTLSLPEILGHIVSGVMASLGFYLLYIVTKKKGMGFGDVKLVGVLGLLVGFPNIIILLYAAFLTGAIVGVILMIGGKAKMKTKVPFGPFLLLGAVIASVWGQPIWQWWTQFV